MSCTAKGVWERGKEKERNLKGGPRREMCWVEVGNPLQWLAISVRDQISGHLSRVSNVTQPAPVDVTQYLVRLNAGDGEAVSELLPVVYQELRGIAGNHLRKERAGHTLQPTALVHEAFLKLVNQDRAVWKDRAHFLAVAASAMQRILIDHARRHRALKRGEGKRVTLDVQSDIPFEAEVDLLGLDEAMKKLAAVSERQSEVVKLRFFGGMSTDEIAHVLDISPRTVKGDWRFARAWLQRELSKE